MVKVKHTGTRRYKERLVGLPWPRVSWVGGFLSPRDYADFKDVDMVIEALGLAGYFLGVFVMSQQCSIPRLIDYIYGLIQIYYPNSIQCIINYHDPWAGKSVLNQRAVFCFFLGFLSWNHQVQAVPEIMDLKKEAMIWTCPSVEFTLW